MKKFFLFLFIIISISCKKETLPEITSTGVGVLAMEIDGIVWKNQKSINYFGPSDELVANYFLDKGKVTIAAHNRKDEWFILHFSLNRNLKCSILPVFRSYDFVIGDIPTCSDSTRFEIKRDDCSKAFLLCDTLEKELILNKLDTINKIISGTFSMTIINRLRTTKKITNGRFDVKYY